MPRATLFAMLPDEQQVIVRRKWEYIRDTLTMHRSTAILQGFNRRMAQEFGVTESTISQVVTGRNMNPEFISKIYEHLESIFGGDPTISTHRAVAKRANIGRHDPHQDIRVVAQELRDREQRFVESCVAIKQQVADLVKEYGGIQQGWKDVDRRIPPYDSPEFRPISEDWELNNLIGGGIGVDRIQANKVDLQMLHDAAENLVVHRRTELDWGKEKQQAEEDARKGYEQFARRG